MLQTYGILDFSKPLTITQDDRSYGQGGEMWFEWDSGGSIYGYCNNGTQ